MSSVHPNREPPHGFTLIELLLAGSVIALVASFILPVSLSLKNRNDLDTATFTTVSALRRASLLSGANSNNSRWGVRIQQGEVVLFEGANFQSRNGARDEIAPILSTITTEGAAEIVFQKFTGGLGSSQTLTLSLGAESQTISINAKGIVTAYE